MSIYFWYNYLIAGDRPSEGNIVTCSAKKYIVLLNATKENDWSLVFSVQYYQSV